MQEAGAFLQHTQKPFGGAFEERMRRKPREHSCERCWRGKTRLEMREPARERVATARGERNCNGPAVCWGYHISVLILCERRTGPEAKTANAIGSWTAAQAGDARCGNGER
jgi:hypothetical protein